MIPIYTVDKKQINLIPENVKSHFYTIEEKVYFSKFTFMYLKDNNLDILFSTIEQTFLTQEFYKKGKLKISLPFSNIFQDRIPKDTLIELILFANSIADGLQICGIKRHFSENKTKYPRLQIIDFQLDLIYTHDYLNSQRIYLLKIMTAEKIYKFIDTLSWLLNSDYKFLTYAIPRSHKT